MLYPNPYMASSYPSTPQMQFNPQQVQNILPHQQIVQVSGKASVDTLQLAPNSSILVMDTSAPIVWMCVSDGIGKVTATPYDIILHQEKPPVDVNSLEQRIATLESAIKEMEEKSNVESNASRTEPREVDAISKSGKESYSIT